MCNFNLNLTTLRSLLEECRTLWGKREQAICILATKERMRYLSANQVTMLVVVAHCWHQSSWAYSLDLSCQSSFSAFPSWSHLLLFGFVFCTFDTFSVQGCSPLCISSATAPCAIEYKSEPYLYDVKCNFRMLCCIS